LEGTLILILVVAEKPSVAMSYAKVLGATNRKDGYLEGNGYLVSWCVGHLVELAPPNVYDAKYVKWSIADLPILPQKWQYLVSASTKKQFGILKDLMNRPDVDSVICATDAGREGELIFRLVYQQAGCKKPFSRLWLSSMEENAIREGFAHLKPSTEYDALYNAALCRERADWMVGINASRLFSCLYNQPLAVGRVMTPVLAMTVVREAAIAAFVPEKFYTVDLELTSGCTASSRRIPEKTVAENLLEACRKEMVATIQRITRKEKSENPPPLYDLTTLQRDANRLLGYSAQQTLDYVQSLYEKKLTTYPRTDSCYITDDDEEMLEELTEELEGFLDIAPEDVDEAAPRTRCTVNREKVTDHHAILPTRSMLQADLEALPKGEQNVLKLIIARTLMAVSKPFRYLETMLTTECAGEEFTAKGKEVLEEGWKAVERKVLADILNRKQELTALPNAAENECGILNAELKEGQTSPPKHFTEDLLLHAMETASADSMPEGVERQGIGTPATRTWFAADCIPALRPCGAACDCVVLWSEGWLMYFDSYITGKRIQQLRKTKGLTQEQFAVKLNISDRHLGKIERGEGTASIDLLVEVAISLNTTLDFLILGVLDTPRERELNAQIKKQHQKIQIFKNKLSNLIDELDTSASV